jgi:hypothetical protein
MPPLLLPGLPLGVPLPLPPLLPRPAAGQPRMAAGAANRLKPWSGWSPPLLLLLLLGLLLEAAFVTSKA